MSRLIEKLDEGEHLQPSDDGYIVYWTQRGGYLTASHLREIADELDRRNKTWHERVMQDVGPPMPKIKPLVWEERTKLIEEWTASSPLGSFGILRKHQKETITIYMAPFVWREAPGDLATIEEAKAWCEQEYERRVRECLE